MDRRHFLKGTALLTGALSLNPLDLSGKESESDLVFKGKKAKNTNCILLLSQKTVT